MGIGKRRGKIHVVFQDSGVGGARDGEGHLVGNREEGVFEQLEGNRVLDGCHDSVSFHGRRFPLGSSLRWRSSYTIWAQKSPAPVFYGVAPYTSVAAFPAAHPRSTGG